MAKTKGKNTMTLSDKGSYQNEGSSTDSLVTKLLKVRILNCSFSLKVVKKDLI